MAPNTDLCYLLFSSYVDQNDHLRYRQKAILTKEETVALQTCGRGDICFTNRYSYEMEKDAQECKWYECYSRGEMEEIKKFLKENGFEDVLKNIPSYI
jgi:hypothetical protein